MESKLMNEYAALHEQGLSELENLVGELFDLFVDTHQLNPLDATLVAHALSQQVSCQAAERRLRYSLDQSRRTAYARAMVMLEAHQAEKVEVVESCYGLPVKMENLSDLAQRMKPSYDQAVLLDVWKGLNLLNLPRPLPAYDIGVDVPQMNGAQLLHHVLRIPTGMLTIGIVLPESS